MRKEVEIFDSEIPLTPYQAVMTAKLFDLLQERGVPVAITENTYTSFSFDFTRPTRIDPGPGNRSAVYVWDED